MKKYKVGIIGATGMVGQRFVRILSGHPWFEIAALAASARSAGKPYVSALCGRHTPDWEIPENIASSVVLDAVADMKKIADSVDFIFCAVDMEKSLVRELEQGYALLECPVISNNSAHRNVPDVPMIIPEINPEHAQIIESQRRRLGTKRGFIAVKSNCSIQSYVPAIHALKSLSPTAVAVCTYQAVSGAGKTLDGWEEINDNIIPYIGGEEEKSELEPLKIWGQIKDGQIIPASSPAISAQCLRVPVSDGHMAAVFASFEKKAELEQMIELWKNYSGRPQQLKLPTAPQKFIYYFDSPDRPQTKLDRSLENGMAVSVGRLRRDSIFDIKFVSLSHNTLRGAAGGAVLMAELLCAEGYI